MAVNKIPGVILAGGRSTRMGGGDKALLPLGGQSVLGHVIERLRPQVCDLALNANGDPGRFVGYDLPVLADSFPDYAGPLAGVLAGMDWAAERGASQIVTAAADTPFFPRNLVERLRDCAAQAELPLAMAVTDNGRHPTFSLWSVELRDDLREALDKGLRKIIAWSEPKGCAKLHVDTGQFDPFFNVNTPEDLLEAQRLQREFGL